MSDRAAAGVQTMLGAAGGACPEIPYGGKVWRVGHPTQSAKKTLEALAVASAAGELRELRGAVPPDAYKEMFDTFTAKVAAKSYRTWGPGWREVVFGESGAHLFLLSLLRENHPEATEADVLALAEHRPEDVRLAVAEVVPNFVLLLLNDLKGVTPEQREQIRGLVADRLAPPPTPTPASTAT